MKPQHLTPVIALSCALAHADAPPSPAGDITNLPLSGFIEATSLEQLADLVVTDTKLGQTPDSVTQRIVVLKSDEIERLPTPNGNLAELMRHTSGQFVNVLSRNDANWGSYAGLGPKYNSYLLDGLPIDAFADAMSLDSAAIERVEIHKGPASVLYSNYLTMDFVGNEAPLAGTTNFVLKNRIETPLTRFAAGFGSWGTRAARAYTQGASGPLSYIVSASHELSDYRQYGNPGSWLQTTSRPHYEKDRVFTNLSYALGRPDHTISLYYQYTAHQGTMGRPNRDFDHTYNTVNFAYNNALNDDWHLQFKYGERHYYRRFSIDDYPSSLALVNRDLNRQTIRPADLTASYRHARDSVLTLGVDGQWVDYKTETRSPAGATTPANRAEARSTGYFVQEKLRWNDWVLRAGLRRNTIHHDYALLGGSVPTTTSAAWSKNLWSMGARYNLSSGLAFYGNAGSSFMVPTAKQIGGTVPTPGASGELPNPALRPESGIGRDLGVDWQATSDLHLNLRGFLNTISDAIVTNIVSAVPSQVRSENAGGARSAGFELDSRYTLGGGLTAFANLTHNRTRISDSLNPGNDGAQIPFAPERLANAGLVAPLPGELVVAAYYHWVGRYYDSTDRASRQSFGSYGVINLRAQKVLSRAAGYTALATADLNNLTDRQYRMPFDFRDPGISAFAGVEVRY